MSYIYDENDDAAVVLVDVQTTGFGKHAHVMQIAAKCGVREFNVYLMPGRQIDPRAAAVNGFSMSRTGLYVNGRRKKTLALNIALTQFIGFLAKSTGYLKCVLVAHQASFDSYYLLKLMSGAGLYEQFEGVCQGFSDSLSLFRHEAPHCKSYSMRWLVCHMLPEMHFKLQNALGNVRALHELINYLGICHNQFITSSRSFPELYQ